MSLIKKKNRFSCITRLKIQNQLENHHKELFSSTLLCLGNFLLHNFTRLQFQNKLRLGYVTSPESKMAERDVSKSLIALILCFFPSLLSSELVLFFTEPKLNASFQRRRLRKSRE